SALRRARPMIRRLRKMIAHEDREASIRMPSTICTGTLASKIKWMTESWSVIHTGSCEKKFRQPLRPQRSGIDTGDPDVRLQQQSAAGTAGPIELISIDLLCEAQCH